MQIAAISDVHGNLAALNAVLADIASRGVDTIVNLGDIVSGGLFPRETADRLIPLGLPTIRGNHERQLLTLETDRMGASDRHAAAELRRDQLDWIAAMPETLRLADDVLLVHGTPGSDLTYFLETVTPQGLRAATLEEIEERAGTVDAAIILCGHTHIARVVRLGDGRTIVNPGSVGLPAYADALPFPHVAESGSPHARYAIVTRGEEGWSAELIQVAYDWDAAARDAEARGRPEWGHALRTGRVG
ncbi:metallophosphoesterase family protein [Sphingomonas sp. M1-B02]|uniref:metallophosphoesterase family protein n=1 Tax=Sphingomonas sp. M1-B02 TaxID=3114300 RepID=UPI00223FF775|nr:metallophosphoesterase family protein [Sphingomonas sp. S6-11]UZK66160.1 metallophosphatase family protein [Sphingomonas sp. S6-11]